MLYCDGWLIGIDVGFASAMEITQAESQSLRIIHLYHNTHVTYENTNNNARLLQLESVREELLCKRAVRGMCPGGGCSQCVHWIKQCATGETGVTPSV
ncbi:hypothetical protein SUGI_0238330 [Cryptomeria japonica]|nr:hypothetical protein SUGI_0238330 [Cryptomeria japonica]